MAAIRISVGSNLANPDERTAITASAGADPATATTAVQSAITTAIASEAAVTAAITASLLDPTIAGNGTALATVTLIQTNFNAMKVLTALEPALATAAVNSLGANVTLVYNAAVVLTKNRIKRALDAALQYLAGSDSLSNG